MTVSKPLDLIYTRMAGYQRKQIYKLSLIKEVHYQFKLFSMQSSTLYNWILMKELNPYTKSISSVSNVSVSLMFIFCNLAQCISLTKALCSLCKMKIFIAFCCQQVWYFKLNDWFWLMRTFWNTLPTLISYMIS